MLQLLLYPLLGVKTVQPPFKVLKEATCSSVFNP